jgi:hypothetical protein
MQQILDGSFFFFQGTNFCGSIDNTSRPLAEVVYNIVIGWIFVFDILHVKEGPTRMKNCVYYALMVAEMIAMLVAWNMEMENMVRREDNSGIPCWDNVQRFKGHS